MNSLFTRTVFRMVILGSLLLSLSHAHAQQKPPSKPEIDDSGAEDVIRVNTALVTLPVSVLDRQGRFIAGLSQGQFHLFEDGVEQQIAYFDSAEKPFTVALVLDTSDSAKDKLESIQKAAIAFVNQLRPADRVFIVAFDKRISVLCEPSSDRAVLYKAIGRTSSGGGTSLYAVVDRVVRERMSHIRGRKAIVLMTDGMDTTSEIATFESTMNAVRELDSLIYSIQYNTAEDLTKSASETVSIGRFGNPGVLTSKGEPLAVALERGRRYLLQLADTTGGRFFYADSSSHLQERFAGIAAELRQQYSLSYYPINKSVEKRKRGLKVRVTTPNVAVRTRQSYVYNPPK